MKKQTKITLSFFLALAVGLGAVFYFVSKKIDASLMKKNIISQIERAIPGSRASIENIEYSLGVRAKILIEEVLVQNADKEDILVVKKTEVEVPVFDILKGGGRLEVKIQDPAVYIRGAKKEESAWENAIGARSEDTPSKKNKSAPSVPSFINKSRWDLKIENLSLNILGLEKENYLIKKLVFKNLNLEKTTAFEVISDFNYVFSNDRSLETEIQAVGEINIAELMDGKLDVNMLVNSEKTALSWTKSEAPPLKNVIKLKGSEGANYELSWRATGSNGLSLETDMTFSKGCCEKISVNKLESSVSLKSLATFLPVKTQEDLSQIDWGDAKAIVNGTLLFEKNEVFRPSLEFPSVHLSP